MIQEFGNKPPIEFDGGRVRRPVGPSGKAASGSESTLSVLADWYRLEKGRVLLTFYFALVKSSSLPFDGL